MKPTMQTAIQKMMQVASQEIHLVMMVIKNLLRIKCVTDKEHSLLNSITDA